MKLLLVALAVSASAAAVEFRRDIQPVLEAACTKCHAKGKDKGGFSFENEAAFLKGGDSGAAIVPGKSAESLLVKLISSDDSDERMPQKGKRLTTEQIAAVRAWIDDGANWPAGHTFARPQPQNLHRRAITPPAGDGPVLDRLLLNYLTERATAPAEPVTDATFARRVWLDTLGLLPPPEKLAAFEKSTAPEKRAALVRELLGDNRRYAEHWLTFWNDLLRNDYRGTGFIDGGRRQISGWLFTALRENKPYDAFVRELAAPTPATEGFTSGILWRGNVNASMTRPMQAAQSVAQVFMGVNLKCASCHDSFVNDWSLADAYGLAAIYADEKLELVECDKPTGRTATVRFLYPEFGEIPAGLPRDERMSRAATLLTSEKNGRLSRTIVNRLWARLMGRGLVEPLDDMDRPAWEPAILDWLAEDLVAHQWDIKHTLERILTSRAYALPSVDAPRDEKETFVFRGPVTRRLTAEQFADALSSLDEQWARLPASMEFHFGTDDIALPKWIWTAEPLDDGPRREMRRAANAQIDRAIEKLAAAKNTPIPESAKALDAAIGATAAAQTQLEAVAAYRATGEPGARIARPDSDKHRVVFQRTFELKAPPAEAYGAVAASQAFEIFINGKEARAIMSDSFRNGRAKLYDLRALLKPGANLVAISVASHTEKGLNSTERQKHPESVNHLNKTPGLAFYTRIEQPGAPVLLLGTDEKWTVLRAPAPGWQNAPATGWPAATALAAGATPVDEGPGLEPIRRRDYANLPVELSIAPAASTIARAGEIRAALLAADPLQTALERPNREIITAARPITATTIQAVELTNGATLDARIKTIAARHAAAATANPAQWLETFFQQTLTRPPTAAERAAALNLLGQKPTPDQLGDLVWAIVNLPEFQLIR